MASVSSVTPTGNLYIDGVIYGTKWASTSLTYSFPTSASFYTGANGAAYGSGENSSVFRPFIDATGRDHLDPQHVFVGGQCHFHADHRDVDQQRNMRYANRASRSTAWGYYPSTSAGRRRRLVQDFERVVQQSGRRQLRLADNHPRDRAHCSA